MTPPTADNGHLDVQRDERRTQQSVNANHPLMAAMSSTRGVRSEGTDPNSFNAVWTMDNLANISTDSWIEIPSRPSSSSLSATSNNIITTGLQIRPQDDRLPRRPQLSQISSFQPRSTSATGSSQDEYEESSSDSDRVMSSSNEDISQDENVDDDDTATALGVGSMNKVFTPQPNAFSHPPSSHGQGQPIPDSYFPAVPSSTLDRRPATVTQRSYQRQTQSRHRTYTSSYQPDHDAALRASLTTLLSCAAAVRPKGSEARPATTVTRPPTQPTALRLVPESELDPARPRPRRTSSPKQTKRKSRESSKERHVKKVRAAKPALTNDELISPTLASWMISAGVVLVFSAISFSAGYAWGREVGRIEGEMGLPGGNCGREALRSSGSGLRRLRWTAATSHITA
ncbi:hypothetical protein LTR13_006084 [Exophiala sideris]|nr:hypothetical protein LTR13_006084 [Exophiala sideris]